MELFGTDRRVLALAFARMADAIGNSFLIVVLPLYIASGTVTGDAFGLGVTLVTGVVLSAFGFLNSLAQPFTGRLSDRTGRRKVYILLGLAILAATSAAYAFADNYAALVLIRAVQGLGVAFTIPCTLALVNELAATDTRGGNMGVFNTFRLLGFGIGPIVAGLVVDAGPYALPVPATGGPLVLSGFEGAFYAAALTAVASYLLVWFLVDDPAETRAAAGEDLTFDVLGDGTDRFLDPVFTLGLASLFMAIGIALFATLQTIVNTRLDQDPQWFGVQFGAFVIANVLIQAPVGRASDRYGRKPFLLAGLALLAPATLMQGVVLTDVPLVDNPWGMLAARLVQGVAGAMVFAPGFALAGDLAKEGQSGTTLSVITMSFGLGTAIGPLMSGYLVRFGVVVPFAAAAALALVGFALVATQVEETVPAGGLAVAPSADD